MMKSKLFLALFPFVALMSLSSCKKYLDAKSDESFSTPGTIEDLQALLDNGSANIGMKATSISTDEYYMLDDIWPYFDILTKYGYIWDDQSKLDLSGSDWLIQYKGLLDANTVLDYLPTIAGSANDPKKAKIKGSALFYRARIFFELAQVYAPPYDKNTSSGDLGIPLRLSSDFNIPTVRATVEETYNRIITDLEEAITLLPGILPDNDLNKVRPTKTAAYGLLARVYLAMENYTKAKELAGLCLNAYNFLLDFNSLDSTSEYPILKFNPEVIFYTDIDVINGYPYPYTTIDSNTIKLYSGNDLRRAIFYSNNPDGSKSFKGSYNGTAYTLFTGIATDEIYLIRAEANARLNDIPAAMLDLDTLLQTRWVAGTFVNYPTNINQDSALSIILTERRKELINRGTRWTDLRRLNKDPRYEVILKRTLAGETYTLPPNDPRYVWLIPQEVINLSGISQNTR